MVKVPDGSIEKKATLESKHLAGVDEVGKGCIAGPVYAAAVILDTSRLETLEHKERNLIRDSKSLSAKQRQKSLIIIKNIIP